MRETMLDDLRTLVEIESPSSDPDGLRACAAALGDLLERRLGTAAALGDDARVRWHSPTASGTDAEVLLLGHLDTVWPLGTLARMPFNVADDIIRGPGTFDMKAGLVVTIHALARLRERGALPPVRLLVTTDEETGSVRSRAEIEEEARRCRRVLVMEPCGANGAVKTARKGVALGHLVARGRASHAGLAPEEGINAIVALAGVLPAVAALSDADRGTTVTPTLVSGGSAVNTVPASCEAHLDMRFLDAGEVDRVRAGLRGLDPSDGAEFEVRLEVNRPALEPSASAPLLPVLHAAATSVGQTLETVTVGGASDGNLAAAAGAAVLDGLGPEGDGAHADHEHVTVGGMRRRLDLLTSLIPAVAAAAPHASAP